MTMPKFEPVAFVQSDPDGHLHLAEITKTEACQNLDQWDRQVGWKAVPLHTADQLTEAYEAGKRDATPEGYALVPKQPTLLMLRAMYPCESTTEAYKAMLAAAPKGEE